jgi:hypothetical protein
MSVTLEQLQNLLPDACAWAETQEAKILSNGVKLTDLQMSDATKAGVVNPGKIRLLKVLSIPAPSDPVLAQAAAAINLITPFTLGMALRYGIFIRADVWGSREILVHECVHTAQYERLGGFLPFLKAYLHECVTIGYPDCPMEQEAVRKAAEICRAA